MRTEGEVGRISCNQSMSIDTLGFTSGMEGLRLRGSMTYFRVKLVDALERSTYTLVNSPII